MKRGYRGLCVMFALLAVWKLETRRLSCVCPWYWNLSIIWVIQNSYLFLAVKGARLPVSTCNKNHLVFLVVKNAMLCFGWWFLCNCTPCLLTISAKWWHTHTGCHRGPYYQFTHTYRLCLFGTKHAQLILSSIALPLECFLGNPRGRFCTS